MLITNELQLGIDGASSFSHNAHDMNLYLIKFTPAKAFNLMPYYTGKVFAQRQNAEAYCNEQNSGVSAQYGVTSFVMSSLEDPIPLKD